jgi:hypothetical protein
MKDLNSNKNFDYINFSASSGGGVKTNVVEFKKFHKLLIQNAPNGYTPFYFKCDKEGKNPYMPAGKWLNAGLTSDKAIAWLQEGGNIGIAGLNEDQLVIIDIDDETITDYKTLKPSLTARSGSRTGVHLFYFEDMKGGIPNIPTDEAGEIRANNQYVIAPGSYVSGYEDTKDNIGEYTVEVAIAPTKITLFDIPSVFSEQLAKTKKDSVTVAKRQAKSTNSDMSAFFNLSVYDIITDVSDPQNRFPSIFHTSKTGENTSISSKGLIQCWRHHVSMNAQQALCVLSGFLTCQEAGEGHVGGGAGPSLYTGNDEALFHAWKYARENKYIPEEDPTPGRVMRFIAISQKFCKEGDIKDGWKLPNAAYKKANDYLEREYTATEPKKAKKAAKKGRRSNEEEEIIIHTSKIEHDGGFYEEIYNDGAVAFIDGNGVTYERLDVDGVAHEPINGDELTEGAVLLPSDIEDYGDEKVLIAEIKAHIHKYVDVSSFFETISAYYVLLTWLYDEVNTLPYLRALGDTGCGKSRYEDVVGRICYKATIVSGAITPAPIYRLIRKWRGTLIIDEGDFKASDEQNEVVKILNCGFERGRPVVRSQKDNPDNLQFLPTFSPKILSSRKRFKDVALESRCLTEIMKETDREDIPYLLPPEFYEVEASLRNKLLKFRFLNHGKVDIQKAQKLKTVKVEDRLKQAVSSFVVLFANNAEVYEGFIAFLVSYNAELVEERADTIEGAIVSAIFQLVKEDGKKERTFPTQSLSNVHNDVNGLFTNEVLEGVYITATDIAEHLKENNGLQDVTSRGVGRRLKTLGITSKKKGTGAERRRYLDLKERSLAKLIKKYIPSSVDEMDEKAVKDVGMGDRGGKIKSYSPVEKATCEQCGEEHFLDHEWEDGEQKRLICSKCAEELMAVASND